MIKLKDLISEITYDNSVWFHGSASGDLRGGKTGLHLGTALAAKEALEATIGIPVDGEWDGTREYGKTLLCGKNTLKQRGIFATGFNCDVPNDDFYPTLSMIRRWSSFITLTMKPAIKKYKIICPMTNTNTSFYNDGPANGYMRASLKRGNAKRGFYYRNVSEDPGSISAVVPNGDCVKEI
jgi:hypothetical protein